MKQRKYSFLLFVGFFLSIFFVGNTYSCTYKGLINECISANDSGTTKAIENFVCIVGTDEEVTYQVVVDQEFKLLDDEMDLYLEELETNKNYYFGKDRKKTYIDGLNDIESKRKDFKQKYYNLCGTNIINEAMLCLGGETSISNAKSYFNPTDCGLLVDKKLEIFDEVAYSILLLNKKQVRTDEKKIYDQAERKNYNLLLELMNVNLAYIGRIVEKWNTKLQNTY